LLALRKRTVLIDLPNLRSNHKQPTPKGGGIAVVFALIICLLIADIHYSIVLSILLLAAVSLMDDLIQVPPFVRLLVQVLAVSIPLTTMAPLFGGMFPKWLDHAIVGALWIWFINLFNFMDGIDGISGVEMCCIGIGLCLISVFLGTFPNSFAAYSLILASAGFGFLWWNWHPAKIFLGDVGSVPIGFITGYLLLLAAKSGYVGAAFILPAYYLADSTLTLIQRIGHGKKIWVAHSEHYYQKAVRRGRRHSTVARYICGVNLLLMLLAVLSVLDRDLEGLYVALAYLAVFLLLGFFAHTGPNPHHDPV